MSVVDSNWLPKSIGAWQRHRHPPPPGLPASPFSTRMHLKDNLYGDHSDTISNCSSSCPLIGVPTSSACIRGCVVNDVSIMAASWVLLLLISQLLLVFYTHPQLEFSWVMLQLLPTLKPNTNRYVHTLNLCTPCSPPVPLGILLSLKQITALSGCLAIGAVKRVEVAENIKTA